MWWSAWARSIPSGAWASTSSSPSWTGGQGGLPEGAGGGLCPQPVITKDNVTMQIDTVIYFQITDPKLYTYGVEHPHGRH